MGARIISTGAAADAATVVHIDAGEHGTVEVHVDPQFGQVYVNQREHDGGLRRVFSAVLGRGARAMRSAS